MELRYPPSVIQGTKDRSSLSSLRTSFLVLSHLDRLDFLGQEERWGRGSGGHGQPVGPARGQGGVECTCAYGDLY